MTLYSGFRRILNEPIRSTKWNLKQYGTIRQCLTLACEAISLLGLTRITRGTIWLYIILVGHTADDRTRESSRRNPEIIHKNSTPCWQSECPKKAYLPSLITKPRHVFSSTQKLSETCLDMDSSLPLEELERSVYTSVDVLSTWSTNKIYHTMRVQCFLYTEACSHGAVNPCPYSQSCFAHYTEWCHIDTVAWHHGRVYISTQIFNLQTHGYCVLVHCSAV